MMRQKLEDKTRNRVDRERCRHYWIIEIANGPKSRGVCQYCGESRDFLNSIPGPTVPKRGKHPLDLPEISKVELDEDSKS
jgi:hypothetical protein